MGLPAFVDPSDLCCSDAFHLSFSAKVRLELSKHPEHIKESFAGR
ncbi:unnamed protein product [Ciceribacter selenitireducens ATCC BAA-1503]|uniref:Uncharacterized protein n=1 Tax=Ciceribacter selenitireducens ATCC BAA-1503 TaxID=1336235 RepID=A0A376AG61_9HYPH|nr:unnamed protein product [Ciceribacter selenitireducens ATCC BAA-1503]